MAFYEFKKQDAEEFATSRGIRAFEKGNELVFSMCPYCRSTKKDDKNKFSINLTTGQFQCFRASCGAQGNMITLARDFEFSLGRQYDEYYQPKRKYRKLAKPKEQIIPKEPAVEYMQSRGISEEITKKYELTTRNDKPNELVFPFFDDKGNLQFIKYRRMDYVKDKTEGPKEYSEKDCKPILFGMKQKSPDATTLIITEGQIDSLSVAEALKGVEYTRFTPVSVPNGAHGFTWVPYCYDWIKTQFEEIIVFGDCEEVKITLVQEINDRFKNGLKIKHVRLEDYQGCKDANEILTKHGAAAVRQAVFNAVLMPLKRVISHRNIADIDLYHMPKLKTGISVLDRCFCGGLPYGGVTIITGKAGKGKTTLAQQIISKAFQDGEKVFIYSGENSNESFKAVLDMQIAGPTKVVCNQTIDGRESYFVTNPNKAAIADWLDERCFFYETGALRDSMSENLPRTIEESIQQYGTRVILVDNLMTAVYIDGSQGNIDKFERQTMLVKNLALIAKEYDVLIILIAHRRKGYSTDALDEVSGSSNIVNLAVAGLSFDAPTKEEIEKGEYEETERKLTIFKNRWFGNLNGDNPIKMCYHEGCRRVYAEEDGCNERYDWEQLLETNMKSKAEIESLKGFMNVSTLDIDDMEVQFE